MQQFLLKLEADGDPNAAGMWRLLKDSAQNGTPTNPEKFHNLHGEKGKGLFEFKTRGGARIICFFDLKNIVCTHGIAKFKPKRFDREIEKAQRIKEAYIEEQAANNLQRKQEEQ